MFGTSIYRTLLLIFEWIHRSYFRNKPPVIQEDRKQIQARSLSIMDLPAEILLYHIFMRCDAKSLCEVSISNKYLNEIASDDAVWRDLAKSALIEEVKREGKILILESIEEPVHIALNEVIALESVTYAQLKQQRGYTARLSVLEQDPKHFYRVNTVTNRWLAQKRTSRGAVENSRNIDFVLEENLLLHKAGPILSGPIMQLFYLFNSPMNNAVSFSSWVLIYICICLKLDFNWPAHSPYVLFIPYTVLSVMTLSSVVLISYFRTRGLLDNEHVRARVSGWVSSLCYSASDTLEVVIVTVALGCFFVAFPSTLMLKLDACRSAAVDRLTAGAQVSVHEYAHHYCVQAGSSWLVVFAPLFTFFTMLLLGICKDIVRLASARQRVIYVTASALVYSCFQAFLIALALRLDQTQFTEPSWWLIFAPLWMIEVVLILFLLVCYRHFDKESLSSYFGLQLVYFPVFLFQILICCYLQNYFSYISFAFVHIWILQFILAMILHDNSKKYGVWRSFSFKRRIHWT